MRWCEARQLRPSAAPAATPRPAISPFRSSGMHQIHHFNSMQTSWKAQDIRAGSMLYDLAEAAQIASAGGILLGAVGGSMYFVEMQSKGRVQAELEEARAALRAKDQQLEALRQKLEAAQKEASDLALLRKRQAQYDSDTLKLERALEIRDGQLASFMAVAHRQIKFLEDQVKELQKVPL